MRHSSAELFSFVSIMNSAAEHWAAWMVSMFWHTAVLFALLLLITWLLRHKAARLRYGLWMLFFARLAVPPTLALATGWGWWILPVDSIPAEQTKGTKVAASPVELDDSIGTTVPEAEIEATQFVETAQLVDHVATIPKSQQRIADNETTVGSVEVLPIQMSSTSWLMAAWGIGVVLLMFRLVLGLILTERIRRSVDQCSEESETLKSRLSKCQKRIGFQRRIAIGVGESTAGPMLIGFLRPMIVVPKGISHQLADAELDAVLNHELSHVCRHDVLFSFIQSVFAAVYFFNPVVWIACRTLDRLREDACDETTLAAAGVDRTAYGSGLVKVAKLTSGPPPAIALGMSGGQHQVARRLKRILNPSCPVGRKLSAASMASVVMAAAILIPSAARTSVVEETPTESIGDSDQVQDKEKEADPFDVESIPEKERVVVTGIVVDSDDQPVANATVSMILTWSESTRQVTTDNEGKFSIVGNRKHLRIAMVRAGNEDESLLGAALLPYQLESIGAEPVEIKLAPPHTVKSIVKDSNGKPLGGVTVGFVSGSFLRGTSTSDASGLAELKLPKSIPISTYFAISDQHGFDYRTFRRGRKFSADKKQKQFTNPDEPVVLTLAGPDPVTVQVIDQDGSPIPEVDVSPWLLRKSTENDNFNVGVAGILARELFHRKTNMNGEAYFNFLPPWQDKFSFWPAMKGFVRHQHVYDRKVNDGKLTITLQKTVKMSGVVTMPNREPCSGSEVIIRGDDAGLSSFRNEVRTDEDGRYEVYVDPVMVYLVVARFEDIEGQHLVSDIRDGFAVWPNKPLKDVDLKLRPATRIFGKVTMGNDGSPVENQSIRLALRATSASDAGIDLPADAQGNRFVASPDYWQNSTTDANGQFEFWAGAGQYDLVPSSQNSHRRFTVKGPEPKEFNFKMPRPLKGLLKGTVVDGETGKPVANAILDGAYHSSRVNSLGVSAKTDAKGEYAIERSLHRMTLLVINENRTKGAMVKVGNSGKLKDIELSPLSSAKGTIIDSALGLPAAGFVLKYGVMIKYGNGAFTTRFGGEVTTNDNGEFTIDHLVVGAEYSISYSTGKLSSSRITSVRPKDDSQVQLGEYQIGIEDK